MAEEKIIEEQVESIKQSIPSEGENRSVEGKEEESEKASTTVNSESGAAEIKEEVLNEVKPNCVLILGPACNGKTSVLEGLTSKTTFNREKESPRIFTTDIADYKDVKFVEALSIGNSSEQDNKDSFELVSNLSTKYNILRVVFLVGVEQLGTEKHQLALEAAECLFKRFINFGNIVEYVFEDNLGILTKQSFLKLYGRNFERYERINVGVENFHFCQDGDVSSVVYAINKSFVDPDVKYLEVNEKVTVCTKCNTLADVNDKGDNCSFHAEGKDLKHGELEKYHSIRDKIKIHPGKVKGLTRKSKHYTCCKKKLDEKGCTLVFPCCNEETSEGCQERCTKCLEDSETAGCIGICSSCELDLDQPGCQTASHTFA
eukprot:snap_masked-scaffold_6-processed-gene-11.57-mRNA-1 protein AED:0.09 eAED:1.00 QI:0/-1/0/1/-1/1/1/0/373